MSNSYAKLIVIKKQFLVINIDFPEWVLAYLLVQIRDALHRGDACRSIN